MAQEKEEIILEFKIDQDDAIVQLEKTKKSILLIKQEQQELNKAYKEGNITLDEFVKEGVRLEGILKKQQSSYNNVQKSVTGVKTQLDKLIDSNKKISKDLGKTSEAFKEAAGNISVAGVSVGSITTKLASFANPATAAVGIASALGAAYASSAAGARDLESATNQLSAATAIATNDFGDLIDKLGGGDGSGKDGILSTLASAVNAQLFGLSTAISAKISADTKRALKEIELVEIASKRQAKDFLDQAEVARRYRDDQDKDLQARLTAANDVEGFINQRESALIKVQEDKLRLLNSLLSLDKGNLEIKKQVKLVEFEIADIQEDSEGKRTEAINGVLNVERQIAALRTSNSTDFKRLSTKPSGDILPDDKIQIDSKKSLGKILRKLNKDQADDLKQNKKEEVQATELADQAKLQSAIDITAAAAAVFKQGSELQKALTLFSIGLDTADAISSLTAASEANPANAVTFGAAGITQFASGVVRILTNIAAATSYITAAGGGEFTTKGPTMFMVGDNPGGVERVTVEPISGRGKTTVNGNTIAMAGGGSALVAGNPGGLNSNALTTDINQSLLIANSMKRMPPPQVAVRDIRKALRTIDVKDKFSKAI